MIRAAQAELPAVQRLLSARAAFAMFPLSNLRAHGLGGAHPHGMTIWIDRAQSPKAVLGLSNDGMVMPFWGKMPATAGGVLRGRPLSGFAGPAQMVRPLMGALELGEVSALLDKDEPHFLLLLAAMQMPEGSGTLAPVTAHRETAIAWRAAQQAELYRAGAGPEDVGATVNRWCAEDTHRLLIVDGTPVSMTGFNARLPESVQVGGVYTPPDLRGRGHARRAVALHLAEARAAGVEIATLFAASDAAVACYRHLGFAQIGTFSLVLFNGKVTP